MKFHKGLYRSICNISSLVNCWLATPDWNNDDSIKQLLADTLKMFFWKRIMQVLEYILSDLWIREFCDILEISNLIPINGCLWCFCNK